MMAMDWQKIAHYAKWPALILSGGGLVVLAVWYHQRDKQKAVQAAQESAHPYSWYEGQDAGYMGGFGMLGGAGIGAGGMGQFPGLGTVIQQPGTGTPGTGTPGTGTPGTPGTPKTAPVEVTSADYHPVNLDGGGGPYTGGPDLVAGMGHAPAMAVPNVSTPVIPKTGTTNQLTAGATAYSTSLASLMMPSATLH
jgi:hypothetical protein